MSRQPFYSTHARCSEFAREARSWLGTPFRQNSMVRGLNGGVDCVGLTAAIHFACRACDRFEFTRLPLDWHLHHSESPLTAFLNSEEARRRLVRFEPDAGMLPGDLVVLRPGLSEYHLMNFVRDPLGECYIHVPIGAHVDRWALGDARLRGVITSIYRIMEGIE